MSRDHLPHLSLLDLEGISVGDARSLDLSLPGVRDGKYVYAEMSGGLPGDTAVVSYRTTAKCLRFHYSAVGHEVQLTYLKFTFCSFAHRLYMYFLIF